MTRPTSNKIRPSLSSLFFGSALLALPFGSSLAALTDLSDIPLANSNTVTMLPNITLILDDSGSMQSNYMPDWVNGNSYCRRNSTQGRNCVEGDPPWNLSSFNGMFYNPAVTYTPPVNADGSVKAAWNGWKASSKNWTSVPVDGYESSYGTINLTTGVPERVWCNSTNATTCSNSANYRSAIASGTTTYSYPQSPYLNPYTIYGYPHYYTGTVQWCPSGVSPWGTGSCQSRRTSVYQYVVYSNWQRFDIKPAATFPAKASTRTDCLGSSCTYDEEMANYANWYAWYRTRIQMARTAMGLAFSDIRGTPNSTDPLDTNYFHARVGFTTISDTTVTYATGTSFLPIANFDYSNSSSQKAKFYDKLYTKASYDWTPLRGALAKVGRIYAGTLGADPVQYSCQKNYAILTTDGYWNPNIEQCGSGVTCTDAGGTGTPVYSAAKVNGTSWIGDMDGATTCNPSPTVTPICNDSGTCYIPTSTDPVAASTTTAVATNPECDTLKKGNTLADIAYYYYHTDLRPASADGKTCINRPSATLTDCTNNVSASGSDPRLDDVATWQHMTTFTVGLGVDGTLGYTDDYKSTTDPNADYVKIKNGTLAWPDPIANSGDQRIDDLWHAAVNGRGQYFSAKNPESLVKSLRTALSAIQAQSGTGASAATSSLNMVQGTNGYVYLAKYKTVDWTADILAYIFDTTNNTISGSTAWLAQSLLDGKVGGTCGDGESRAIYTGSTTRKTFTWADLTATERGYFNNSKLAQYADWNAATRAYVPDGQLLLNYIRGQNRYEDRTRDATWQTSCPTYYRLYRSRAHVLGDIIHSQPLFVGAPWANFSDTGYSSFKAANTSRSPRLYAGANDGMLHAFDANTGQEAWAYVPPIVMPDLYRLADTYYSTNHHSYVDGPLVVQDFFDGSSWKTILVGALGRGGRGIYALDITGTGSDYPKVLWNFTADDDPGLGFTYGAPLVTKLRDGTWVVVLSSGYNNVPNQPYTGNYPTSDGGGHLYVIRASDGKLLRRIDTGEGTSTSPSGLGDVQVSVNDVLTDETAIKAYAGDLNGNLWSFDLNTGAVRKVAALGSGHPIQGAPEVSFIQGDQNTTVLYFGSGRYLGKTDINISDPNDVNYTSAQYIYAIKDDGLHTVVQSDLSAASSNSFAWGSNYGWYLKLGANEFVYIAPALYQGSLAVATVIPTAEACKAGGSGNLYQLDNRNGNLLQKNEFSSPPTGFTWYTYTSSSGSKNAGIIVSTAEGKVSVAGRAVPPGGGGSCTDGGPSCHNLATGDRVMWRELPSD